MRKLLYTILFVGAYFWLVTSGREDLVLEHGKALYKMIITWFDDATVDFQLSAEKPKKRSRRWD